jgi:hypothetical protein
MNATLGAVVYSNDNDRIAYQGGGVWREGVGGARMISPPEFHYRGATLTLPLVTVGGDEAIDDGVVVTQPADSTQHYPDPGIDRVNPLQNGLVNVTVHSEYYRAWGTFFEERTEGTAIYDHEAQTATLTLVVPAGPQTVSAALAATSAGGEIRLSGSGGDTTRTDSYNSSQGDYSSTQTDEGVIATAGDVDVRGNSIVEGTVRSGGFVDVRGSGEVTGDVEYTDGARLRGGTVGGDLEQISGVEGAAPIDTVVEGRYSAVESENNNSEIGVPISGDTLDGGDQTLGPGSYHLNRIDLSGETLTLDTGAGERVTLAVRDYVQLQNDARIEIQGTGEVYVYVAGESTTGDGDHFAIESSGGVVDVADAQNATQFWLYGGSDFQGTMDGTSSETLRFEGVIFAPAGEGGSSSFTIDKAEVFGGVVTGTVEMGNGAVVHYDQALARERAVPEDTTVVRLTYLHISENPVRVEDD